MPSTVWYFDHFPPYKSLFFIWLYLFLHIFFWISHGSHFPIRSKVCVCVHAHARSVAKSCPTVCNPMDCSPPGSSVHGIFQERITGLGEKKKNTGVGCHLLLKGTFLTQWSKPQRSSCLSCISRWILYPYCHLGSPQKFINIFIKEKKTTTPSLPCGIFMLPSQAHSLVSPIRFPLVRFPPWKTCLLILQRQSLH